METDGIPEWHPSKHSLSPPYMLRILWAFEFNTQATLAGTHMNYVTE